MMKLMLLLFICAPYIMLNAQQQQIHSIKREISIADSIYVLKSDTSYSAFKNPIQFNSFIQLKVHGLSKLLQLSVETEKPVNLFLDGIEMKGIAPVGTDPSREVLFFILHRDSASMLRWRLVRRILTEKTKKELLVSVGLEGENAVPSSLRLSAELSRSGDYYLAFLTFSLATILFSFLTKRSNVFRRNRQNENDMYSIPKTLTAFWTFIIFFSVLFLMASANTIPHVTLSVIMVLTITMLTALAGLLIDNSRYSTNKQQTVSQSKTFISDLVSDAKGINIFNLQLFLITFITGSYFVLSVVSEMLFPAFDCYFLILFCLSHLIYLTSKWFEKTTGL